MVGIVTASTSSTLLVMRENLEDKQVTPSVVYVESSIGIRTGGGGYSGRGLCRSDPGMWTCLEEGNLVQKIDDTHILINNSFF